MKMSRNELYIYAVLDSTSVTIVHPCINLKQPQRSEREHHQKHQHHGKFIRRINAQEPFETWLIRSRSVIFSFFPFLPAFLLLFMFPSLPVIVVTGFIQAFSNTGLSTPLSRSIIIALITLMSFVRDGGISKGLGHLQLCITWTHQTGSLMISTTFPCVKAALDGG